MKSVKLYTTETVSDHLKECASMRISAKTVRNLGYEMVMDENGDVGFVPNGNNYNAESSEVWEMIRERIMFLGYDKTEACVLVEKLGTEMFRLDIVKCIK